MTVTEDSLFAALDATWPAARSFPVGPWTIREGAGGGQRVSAATANGKATEEDISAAEAAMRAIGQQSLFMIRKKDAELDVSLVERGYEMVDPVAVYTADVATVARSAEPASILASWPPLAIQREIWASGGVGDARLQVMARAACDKVALLARYGDRAVATTFVACDGPIAMLHALEVAPIARRRRVGTAMMAAAADWAKRHGADTLALMVTRDNAPANALYRSLGMTETGQYHYRRTAMVST